MLEDILSDTLGDCEAEIELDSDIEGLTEIDNEGLLDSDLLEEIEELSEILGDRDEDILGEIEMLIEGESEGLGEEEGEIEILNDTERLGLCDMLKLAETD